MIKRAVCVFFLFFCLFCGVTVRYMSLSENTVAEAVAEQSTATLTVATARGTIYDRNGEPLVNRSRELRLCIAPYPRTVRALSETLSDDMFSPLSERLKSGRPIVTIADDAFPDVRGVLRFHTPVRHGERVYAPHLLGYLNGDESGAVGLELAYDGFLKACEGRLTVTYEINAAVESTVVIDDKELFVEVSGDRRVQNVLVNGTPIDPAATYTLASTDYMLELCGDGYNMFADNNFLLRGTMIDNQVLINYITEALGGVVGTDYADPYGQGRITIIE